MERQQSVYIASNCNSSEAMFTVERCNKGIQAKIVVRQLFLTDQYNKGVGEIDKAN